MRFQVVEFVFGELKHEVGGKPIYMTLHVPYTRMRVSYEDAGLDAIKLGQVLVQHDFVRTNQIDPLLDGLHRNDLLLGFVG